MSQQPIKPPSFRPELLSSLPSNSLLAIGPLALIPWLAGDPVIVAAVFFGAGYPIYRAIGERLQAWLFRGVVIGSLLGGIFGCQLGSQTLTPAPAIPTLVSATPTPISMQAEEALAFIRDTVIPAELDYFRSDVGFDAGTGAPFDHVRIDPSSGELSEVGRYSAPSKSSLFIPVMLGVIQQKPGFDQAGITVDEARQVLTTYLETLRRFDKEFTQYRGLRPWHDIRADGRITPRDTFSSLDAGQESWALVAVVGAMECSERTTDRELASLAQDLLDRMDYNGFYNPTQGLLHGTVHVDQATGEWDGTTYYLNDMFEGAMGVLWVVLHGQAPEIAWDNLRIPIASYTTQEGETIDTLKGFLASFHEHWALAFLPYMRSDLAPLYKNFLHVQADHANKNGLPGFTATAYDPQGSYRQMGVPAIAVQPVERDDVAVSYATAMAMMVDREVGAIWLANLQQFPGLLTDFGMVESVGPDGFAPIFTADAKSMTILAAGGGVVDEVTAYLKSRTVPGSDATMYERMLELLNRKAGQIGQPIRTANQPVPLPAEQQIKVQERELAPVGPVFNVSAALQPGHFHGHNVRSIGALGFNDDVRPGGVLAFRYEIGEKDRKLAAV